MGNCFGKTTKNRVGPGKRSLQQPTVEEQMNMVKDLTEKGQEPAVNKGGVAFVVDFNDGDPQRMPSRLADRLDETEKEGDKIEVEYTEDEKALMAEVLRDDILREKKEKAAKEEEKVKQAARRREEMEKKRLEKLGHGSDQKDASA